MYNIVTTSLFRDYGRCLEIVLVCCNVGVMGSATSTMQIQVKGASESTNAQHEWVEERTVKHAVGMHTDGNRTYLATRGTK